MALNCCLALFRAGFSYYPSKNIGKLSTGSGKINTKLLVEMLTLQLSIFGHRKLWLSKICSSQVNLPIIVYGLRRLKQTPVTGSLFKEKKLHNIRKLEIREKH